MSSHWADHYIGRAYEPRRFDCAHLAEQVQREVFGRDVTLAANHARLRRDVSGLVRDHGIATTRPAEGDFVCMQDRNGRWHVGVYFVHNATGYVLHNTSSAGYVTAAPLARLVSMGLTLEGFYQWKA